MKPAEHTFALRTEHITLGQLLKASGFADSGTEARAILDDGGIHVNGVQDNRRGRKLYSGDVVRLKSGETVRVTS